MRRPFVTSLMIRLAKKAGVKIFVEPKYGYVGQLSFKNGLKRYFKTTNFDLNTLGASEIARDKDYANFFLSKMGYKVIPGQAFCTERWARAIGSKQTPAKAFSYALKIGMPVFIKPNSLSQGAEATVVYNRKDFFQSVKAISEHDKLFLVQKVMRGKDYRVVVLDNKIISAYERLPLTVIGDGKRNVKQLLEQKQRTFEKTGRDTVIKLDYRMLNRLKRAGLSLRSVLAKGTKFELLANRNLSSGGDALDVTSKMHPSFRRLAIKITKDMGLRFCGVDLMIGQDISRKLGQDNDYIVIEVNSAPGVDNYAKIGQKQKEIVDRMYLEIIRAMGKK